ncbi:MAG: UDP-glucose 4-epimerase GalE [Eubacteriales bacterium]|nr:UDP-glucose 4-epimerase GalE [Eubacteriales bacterium]
MSILVVGGAGYIGSHAAKYLSEKGRRVVVLDNLSTGHRDAIGDFPFYEVDLRDLDAVEAVLRKEKITAVMHFAAKSLVGESVAMPLEYYDNNTVGMLRLLEAMRRLEINNIIFSSTAAVYGEVEKMPITEDVPCRPKSPYGSSKLMMEEMMQAFDQAYGMRYVALRYFNAAGAAKDGSLGERHSPETHLIPIILDTALGRREKIEIFGSDYPTPDGTCIRDYIHVEDLISAHLLALERLEQGGDSAIYNLASQSGFSNLEVLAAAREVTGAEIPHVMGERRAGDPAVLIADNRKAIAELGWELKHNDIHEIIGDAWNFHKKFFGQD